MEKNQASKYDHVYHWRNNDVRRELKGKPCCVVERGSSMNAVLIEFEDGLRIITSRRAVRRRKGS